LYVRFFLGSRKRTIDPLLTAREVAAILKVHPNTIYQKAGNGDIPSVMTSSSRIRFKEREIKEWIDKRSRKALRAETDGSSPVDFPP
jgi:excisionase family DNA binding protein